MAHMVATMTGTKYFVSPESQLKCTMPLCRSQRSSQLKKRWVQAQAALSLLFFCAPYDTYVYIYIYRERERERLVLIVLLFVLL